MKTTLIAFLFLASVSLAKAQLGDAQFFSNADQFFRIYVWDGRVNYKSILRNKPLLDSLVMQVAKFDRSNCTPNRLKAFYCNAYQLLVIKSIADHYPVASVKQVNGFYTERRYNVAGSLYSLNSLEQKLIELTADKRVWLALCNGSVSGPEIYNTAFSPYKKLNAELDRRMQSLVNSSTYVIVSRQLNFIAVSQLFNWYFTGNKYEALAFINKYRFDKIDTSFNLVYMDYDWTLNDQNPVSLSAYTPMEPLVKSALISLAAKSFTAGTPLIYNMPVPDIEEVNNRIEHKNNFDTDYGFRNESRYLESNTYELRLTDKFYTQTDFYNRKMLRVSSDYRSTYNQVMMQAAYGLNSRMQGGLYYSSYSVYNDDLPAEAMDFFRVSNSKKTHLSDLQFYSKYKWYDKKYRVSSLIYFSVPIVEKRKNDKVAIGSKSYDLSLQGYYDRYPVEFMRMILNAEFLFHYSILKEKTTLDFNPKAQFIFPLLNLKPVKLTAIMDLQVSINKEKINPFTGIESIAASIQLARQLNGNAMYQYYFIGKDGGGGHAFRFEILYAIN